MADKKFPTDFSSRKTANIADKLLIQNVDTGVDQYIVVADLIKGLTDSFMQLFQQTPNSGLLPVMIRNVERMNDPWSTSETRWLVTAHDTVNKIITLDKELPIEIMDYGTASNKRWQLMSAAGSNVQITYVDWIAKQIYYSTLRGSFSASQVVTFWNPFRNFVLNPYSYVIGTNAWATTFVNPGGIWLHSDGEYRMIVNGYNSSYGMTGLYKSADLLTWTDVTGAYYFRAGTAPFNEAWCVNAATHWTSCSPVKIPGTANYAKPFQGINAAGRGEVGIVIHNEDYGIVTMPTAGISIPGYPLDSTHHYLPGALVYFKGVWYLSITYQNSSTLGFEILLVTIDSPTTYVVTSVELVAQQTARSYASQVLRNCGLLVYNDELLVLAGGQCDDATDGPLDTTNELYGMYHKKYGTWQPHSQNPVIANPMYGENVYSGCGWAIDHMGASLCFIQRGNYLYLFVSLNSSTDTYKIGKMDMLLKT
jgi:hypothetical protein